MEYTKKEKKAIKNAKEFANTKYGILSALEVKTLLNLIERQNKEIARLDVPDVVINDIGIGNNLLNRIATDYAETASKEIELQSVTGYTIDFIIDLFKRGFVLVNEGEIKDEIRKKVDIFFDNLIFAKDINELTQALKEELLGGQVV